MDLRRNSGAVLPIVLVFSVFALIAATLYIAGQFTIAKPALVAPASFQALCTARSGIWKAMRLMSLPAPDTLSRINTLDTMFNKKLFGTRTQAVNNGSSSAFAPLDSPEVVAPFSADSFGTASVSMAYTPCFKVLTSTGEFRNMRKSVRAFFGGRFYNSADTVCYLLTAGKPDVGIIDGKVAFPHLSAPPSDSSAGKQGLRMKDLTEIVAYYRSRLSEKNDTMMPKAPLTIQSADQLKNIPEVVNGSLFVNGVFRNVAWKEKRRIFVLGDVQITGKVSIEDVEFVVAGEVKCCDDSRLRNVSVFCVNRLIVQDRAVFSGSALTMSSALICKNAHVEDRSIIVAYGDKSAMPPDTAKKKSPLPISVFLSQNASVDGVVIACGSPGGIKTDKNVIVKGIVWASGTVVHQGALYGILRANDLTDFGALMARIRLTAGHVPPAQKNTMTGSIHRLPEVTEYFCPFFLGAFAIVRWEEG
jgi:hypothetical protein